MLSLPPPSPAPPPPSSPCETPARYTLRPWREFFDTKTLSFPTSFSETLTRLETNLSHFRVNYGILYFMIYPLLIFVHHLSIVTLVLTSVFLLAFYRYFTASPIEVDDQNVGRILFFAGMFCMVITHYSGGTVLVFILVYSVMVCFHSALKVPGTGEDPYDRLLNLGVTGTTYNTMESSL